MLADLGHHLIRAFGDERAFFSTDKIHGGRRARSQVWLLKEQEIVSGGLADHKIGRYEIKLRAN